MLTRSPALRDFTRKALLAVLGAVAGAALLTAGIYALLGERPWREVESPYLVAKEADWRANPETNAVFIGSSVTFRQIDPVVFDAELAGSIRSYNLGNEGFYPMRSISYLEYLIVNAPPELKLVVAELFRLDEVQVNYKSLETMRIMGYRAYLDTVHTIAVSAFPRRYKLWLLQQYSRALAFKALGFGMVSYLTQQRELRPLDMERLALAPQGFLAKDHELAVTAVARNAENLRAVRASLEGRPHLVEGRRALHRNKYLRTWPSTPSPYTRRLHSLIEAADARGVHLVFLLPPLLTDRDVYFAYPAFLSLPEHNRLDLSDPDRYPELYNYDMLYDLEHLNSKGAAIYSQQLGLAYAGLIAGPESKPFGF